MKLGTEQNEGKRQMEMIQLGAGRSYLGAYGGVERGGPGGGRGFREEDLQQSPGSLRNWRPGYSTRQGNQRSESRKIV